MIPRPRCARVKCPVDTLVLAPGMFIGVKLFYWKYDKSITNKNRVENLGDYLSKIVMSYFAPKVNYSINQGKTLYGIGSILGFRCQDATVWGSGILDKYYQNMIRIKWSKYDIRAVRGPKTREVLIGLKKECPMVYGDPAILMPIIFHPETVEQSTDCISVILNHANNDFIIPKRDNIFTIDILTTDYKKVITRIYNSKLVISSSLHGIILAESYGIPSVLLLHEGQSTFKYEDWYLSTERTNIVIAHSIEEALQVTPMCLPKLSKMQKRLIESFPQDLWEQNSKQE